MTLPSPAMAFSQVEVSLNCRTTPCTSLTYTEPSGPVATQFTSCATLWTRPRPAPPAWVEMTPGEVAPSAGGAPHTIATMAAAAGSIPADRQRARVLISSPPYVTLPPDYILLYSFSRRSAVSPALLLACPGCPAAT